MLGLCSLYIHIDSTSGFLDVCNCAMRINERDTRRAYSCQTQLAQLMIMELRFGHVFRFYRRDSCYLSLIVDIKNEKFIGLMPLIFFDFHNLKRKERGEGGTET